MTDVKMIINTNQFNLIILGVIVIIIASYLICDFFHNPFKWPSIDNYIDISGKRSPVYDDYIEEWVIENQDNSLVDMFNDELDGWDYECKRRLDRTLVWKNHKTRIYQDMRHMIIRDNYKMFYFIFFRNQTRYRQENYQRTAYKVQNIECEIGMNLSEMLALDKSLDKIGYETTLNKYNSKNQRKLMTRELRERIMERDNYTCQICGKYMPDEVGLHVDHIIPIKKGGKTVESNLQVLCDKCNLGKGSKKIG